MAYIAHMHGYGHNTHATQNLQTFLHSHPARLLLQSCCVHFVLYMFT